MAWIDDIDGEIPENLPQSGPDNLLGVIWDDSPPVTKPEKKPAVPPRTEPQEATDRETVYPPPLPPLPESGPWFFPWTKTG